MSLEILHTLNALTICKHLTVWDYLYKGYKKSIYCCALLLYPAM